MKNAKRVSADRLVSGLFACLGVATIVDSTTFQLSIPAGPWLVPMLCGVFLVVLGLIGTLQGGRYIPRGAPLALRRLAFLGALLIAYLMMLSLVGFVIASIGFSLGAAFIVDTSLRMRAYTFIIGTAATMGLFALFQLAFGIALPSPTS